MEQLKRVLGLHLEDAFRAQWAALRAMELELNATERRYMEIRVKRPVMGEMSQDEIDDLRNTKNEMLPPSLSGTRE
ncbi:hypothetical protein [Mesorhizobium cantuariense]|uniref:Uncharacterized protein n=1 Tax=Mesorhizobium cantuariense TaxID=1300275 RepID=A0ABV7MMR6_9HYPH